MTARLAKQPERWESDLNQDSDDVQRDQQSLRS